MTREDAIRGRWCINVQEPRPGWAPVQENKAGNVPMEIAEAAYQEYARRYGTSQSLKRLNERAGFGWAELVDLLYSRLTQSTTEWPP